MAQVVAHQSNKLEALSLIPSTAKEKKKNGEETKM
jgi:hypothetical protein